MSEKINPAKSRNPEVIQVYLESLGFTTDEATSLIPNWTRVKPQTMEEVRQGIEWEREGRKSLSERRSN
ncbi:MAG: hypothetical protein PVJ52_00925 [Candidatus Woesebacteria bacterium]|jgi:hypothetical protein